MKAPNTLLNAEAMCGHALFIVRTNNEIRNIEKHNPIVIKNASGT